MFSQFYFPAFRKEIPQGNKTLQDWTICEILL